MNAGEISSIVVAVVSLAGALTAYLKSRTAAGTAADASAKIESHLTDHYLGTGAVADTPHPPTAPSAIIPPQGPTP